MREQGYFVDIFTIDKMEQARDLLRTIDDRLTDVIVEIEGLNGEEYKTRRAEYRSVYEAHSRIDYALDHLDQAFSALRKA